MRSIARETESSAATSPSKFCRDDFARDVERLGRFEREAKVLASLNHPGIAAIYGLEHSDDVHYLVLELVPGETLAERIGRGPMPVDEAVPIAANRHPELAGATAGKRGDGLDASLTSRR